jgi:hypothetical protein
MAGKRGVSHKGTVEVELSMEKYFPRIRLALCEIPHKILSQSLAQGMLFCV